MAAVYLDSTVVVYAVEDTPARGPRASSRLTALRASGADLVVSDLVRLECLVKPLRSGSQVLLRAFGTFFASPDIRVAGLSAAAYDRGAMIRARHGFETPDALHLAAALEAGCEVFLTNDAHLSGFADLRVEML